MPLRSWIAVLVALGLIGWWHSPRSPRVPPVPARLDADSASICRISPRAARGDLPLQTPLPRDISAIRLQGAVVQPLAGFSVDARVLGREDYRFGPEATFSPTDLALGWGRMRDDRVVTRLDISQSGRWYRYRWQGEPPLPLQEIIRSSANMHMIPADKRIAAQLHGIRPNDNVRIGGWLVSIRASDGWRWNSSLRRDDSGRGACELVYVCEITRQ